MVIPRLSTVISGATTLTSAAMAFAVLASGTGPEILMRSPTCSTDSSRFARASCASRAIRISSAGRGAEGEGWGRAGVGVGSAEPEGDAKAPDPRTPDESGRTGDVGDAWA